MNFPKSFRKSRAFAILLLGFVLTAGASTFADTLTGEVRGTVLDVESRQPLVGAAVTLTNVDRGWQRVLESDAEGKYVFIQLEPGNYTVSIEVEDYYPSTRTNVLIRLNQPKVVVPPFEMRRTVPTPTQQVLLRGEQTKTAIIDLTAPGATPVVLAFIEEPGMTSMVSLQDWAHRYNFESSLIRALPLRDSRSFDEMAFLAPGVFPVPFSSGFGPAVGIGVGAPGQFSVNGMRGRSNNFTVDGSDNNDEDIGVRRQGFVSLVPQSTESVEEFQIVTAGFPAQFGRSAGSIVNAVSRSGGNRPFHGSVYGFFNQSRLNSKPFFGTPFSDEVNSQAQSGGSYTGENSSFQQFGGVAGGTIAPERLFYFLSVEGNRRRSDQIGHFVVPTASERGLRTRDGFVPIEQLGEFFASRNIPHSSQVGLGAFSLYPLPNNAAGPFGAHTYSQVKPRRESGIILSQKVNWYVTSVHSLTARYNFTDDEARLPFTGEAIESSLTAETRTQNLSLFLNSSTPTLGSVLRISFGRTAIGFPHQKSSPLLFGSAPGPEFPSQFLSAIETPFGTFGPFGSTGPIGQLTILPYSSVGIDVFNFPQGRVQNTYQISDILTWLGGSHSVKFGFDIRHSQLNSFSDRNNRPLLIFGGGSISSGCMQNPFCPFATDDGLLYGSDAASLGAAAGFLQSLNATESADSSIALGMTHFDLFVQDDWRLADNLTINLGLRYSYQTVPKERHRKIEDSFQLRPGDFPLMDPAAHPNFRELIQAGNDSFLGALQAWNEVLADRSRIYSPDRNNFAPRIGLAWDPFKDGRTAVRAGFGLFYDSNLGSVTSQSRNVFPANVPLNLDSNFRPPNGLFVNNPRFFSFAPTGELLIRPDSLNVYNLSGAEFGTGLGILFTQSPPFPGANLSSNGLAFTLPEKDFKNSYAQHFTLSVERQLGEDFLTSFSYIGTRGVGLTRFVTPNGGLISNPVLFFLPSAASPLIVLDIPPTLPPAEVGRPERRLGAFTVFQNSAASTYHSWQAMVSKRLSRGIQLQSSWTWAHVIDEVSDPFDGRGFFSLPQDHSQLHLERGPANFDMRHRVSTFLMWDLPDWSASRFFHDWSISLIGRFQTGQPYTVNTSFDVNRDGNLTDRLDTVEGLSIFSGSAHPIRIAPGFVPNDFVGSNGPGSVGRNTFRADGQALIDLAMRRDVVLSEGVGLDVRLEVFNLFNRTPFGIPNRILESPGFGKAFDTQADPRTIRLAFRVAF